MSKVTVSVRGQLSRTQVKDLDPGTLFKVRGSWPVYMKTPDGVVYATENKATSPSVRRWHSADHLGVNPTTLVEEILGVLVVEEITGP